MLSVEEKTTTVIHFFALSLWKISEIIQIAWWGSRVWLLKRSKWAKRIAYHGPKSIYLSKSVGTHIKWKKLLQLIALAITQWSIKKIKKIKKIVRSASSVLTQFKTFKCCMVCTSHSVWKHPTDGWQKPDPSHAILPSFFGGWGGGGGSGILCHS